MYIKKVM